MIPPWRIASFTLFWDVYLYTSWDRIVPLTFLTYPCCLVIMAIEGRFHVPFGKLRPVPPRFQPDPFRFCWGWGFKSRMDDAAHGETVGSTLGNPFFCRVSPAGWCCIYCCHLGMCGTSSGAGRWRLCLSHVHWNINIKKAEHTALEEDTEYIWKMGTNTLNFHELPCSSMGLWMFTEMNV